ncbi:MAG: Gfo/Idh/MocA family oxidoreductase [Bacteroidales bacterium]|nr:Gfo/Idh/MocA family oxidoreductase [Bacteroidales bacterium]
MERRTFIKNSSLAAIGTGIGLWSCKGNKFNLVPVPENEKIRIGVVGIGARGTDILRVLSKVAEFKVVAICDVLDFRIENAKNHIGNEIKIYSDYRKLLDEKILDAIVISTPLHEHYPIAIDALDAGLHIMCEKALTHTLEQAESLYAKALQSTKLFQVSYQYQLNPTFNLIRELIEKGHCGKITRIEGVWNRNSNWRREPPSPELERQVNWRLYNAYSAGLMAELGSHQLNLIDTIAGSHPLKIMGTGGIDYWKDGRETFDNVYALFDYPGGIKASFSSNLANEYEGFTMKFKGDKATIVTSFMDEAFIYPEKDTDMNWDENTDGVTGASIKIIDKTRRREISGKKSDKTIYPFDTHYFNTTWLLYKNFAAAINGKEKLLLGLKDGFRSALSVHLANSAIAGANVVYWPEQYSVL